MQFANRTCFGIQGLLTVFYIGFFCIGILATVGCKQKLYNSSGVGFAVYLAKSFNVEGNTGTGTTTGIGSGTATGTTTGTGSGTATGTGAAYTVGGTITGLTTSGLVLQNNSGNDLTVSSGASTFTFSNAIASGATYAVTVLTQPTGLTCSVSSGSGTANANVKTPSITCSTTTYTIGGTITGLTTSGLVLRNNAGNDLTVSSGASTFTFSTAIATAYAVTIFTQPSGANNCDITNGSGTATTNVTNVIITCGSNASSWTARTLPNSNGGWYLTSAYGNGRFVTVSANSSPGVAAYSLNGQTWTASNALGVNGVQWYGLTYGNGLFIAVGSGTNAIRSSDGITWSTSTLPNANWGAITYGNGVFVTLASGSRIAATSPDGINWTQYATALPVSADWWSSVAFGNGVFVAVAASVDNTMVVTSTDGITWTQQAALPVSAQWRAVTYAGGRFVIIGSSAGPVGRAAYSINNGVTWTLATTPPGAFTWGGMSYGNGVFIAVGNNNTNATSSSDGGITWTARTLPVAANPYASTAYGNGMFIATTYVAAASSP